MIRITPLRHVKLTIWVNKEIKKMEDESLNDWDLGYLQALKNVKEQL